MKEKFFKESEFIEEDKVEALSEEELDSIAGGATTVYYSKPFINERGQEVVSIRTSSDSGVNSSMFISASKLDDYIARKQGQGCELISMDFAGPLK